jgi:hypothetical protein
MNVKRLKSKAIKSQVKKELQQEIKRGVKQIKQDPVVLEKISKLPPKKRRTFLRKVLLSVAQGAAVTAGVLVTAGVIYKVVGRNFVNNEIDNVTNKLGGNIQKEVNRIHGQSEELIGHTISNLQPSLQPVIDTTIKSSLQNNQGVIDEALTKSINVLKENTGIAGRTVLGPIKKTVNKHSNVRKQVDQNNVLDTPRTRTPTNFAQIAELDKKINEIKAAIISKRKELGQEIQEFGLELTISNLIKEKERLQRQRLNLQKKNDAGSSSFGKSRYKLKASKALKKLKADFKILRKLKC